VAEACRRFGKCFGVAGIYHRPDSMDRVVNEFGARYVLGQVDVGLLRGAMRQNSAGLRAIQRRDCSSNLPLDDFLSSPPRCMLREAA